jgi:hypothetical protein
MFVRLHFGRQTLLPQEQLPSKLFSFLLKIFIKNKFNYSNL